MHELSHLSVQLIFCSPLDIQGLFILRQYPHWVRIFCVALQDTNLTERTSFQEAIAMSGSDSLWSYNPSIEGAIVFAIVYGCATAAHIVQAAIYKKVNAPVNKSR